eukprot:scaffold88344_cov13-Tisochrysis_lutea.AAC.1
MDDMHQPICAARKVLTMVGRRRKTTLLPTAVTILSFSMYQILLRLQKEARRSPMYLSKKWHLRSDIQVSSDLEEGLQT